MRVLVLLGSLAMFSVPRAVEACGGGLVTAVGASVGGDAQRIFISVRGGQTEVVTQIAVPATGADYGALIPLPAQPMIDSQPVDSAELDALDQATRVRVVHSSGGSGGCGCGGADSKAGGARGDDGVFVAEPVAVGPVTAVALSGETGAAVEAWLADNGFVIPAEHQALLAEYAAAGRWFVAVRRNDHAAAGTATSIGLHFTLPGDQRGLPLRFARIGAATKVSFVVFVAAGAAVGPGAPFTGLTVRDLPQAGIAANYSAAIEDAVETKNGTAFVIENVSSAANLIGQASRLGTLVSGEQKITRLTTVVAAERLTADVVFDGAAPSDVPSSITVGLTRAALGASPFVILAWLFALRPRRRSGRHGRLKTAGVVIAGAGRGA